MSAATRATTRGAVRHDRTTARLAELDAIRTVLARAGDGLGHGWVQDDWTTGGGVCLVASIRAHSVGQLRGRCLDVVWHVLHGLPADALLGRVPPPALRLARIRDLTRWNDRPGRTVADVLRLLGDADRLAAAEMTRRRTQIGLTAAVSPAR